MVVCGGFERTTARARPTVAGANLWPSSPADIAANLFVREHEEVYEVMMETQHSTEGGRC
jgi:hypothetical protein